MKKQKGEIIENKGFNLLTVVRMIGLMAPAYLEYEGMAYYKNVFNSIIKKCTRMIIKDNKYELPN